MKKWISLLLAAVLALSLCACAAPASEEQEEQTASPAPTDMADDTQAEAVYTPGEYTASADGNNGPVTVSVTVSDSAITDVVVVSHSETKGISDAPIEQIPVAIVDGQTLAVDVVSGATNTSNAILTAVEDCIRQAGGDVDALKVAASEEAALPEDTETDVLVIGGGGAGMVAAVWAAEEGADVIVVEKLGAVGGTTMMAKGMFGCSASDFHKEQGATETTEDHFNYYMASYPNADPDMIRILAEKSGEAANWLETLGVEFGSMTGPYMLAPVEGRNIGEMVIGALKDRAAELDIDIRVNTAGNSLLTDDSGAVTGAVVSTAEGDYTITADAVVMATGGFAANNEMVAQYNPDFEGLDFICSPGATGDGHKMAEAVGAELVYMDVMKCNATVIQTENSNFMLGAGNGMIVNYDGMRMGNESLGYSFTPTMIASSGPQAVAIFSESMISEGSTQAEARDKGYLTKYNTLEELAADMGINAENLVATAEAFNESAKTGSDEFGRTSFAYDFSEGPYFAAVIDATMQGTFGGIHINENTEALRADGTVIAGLYAAGECAGDGLWGANPVPTNCVFGKIAGVNAAAYAKNAA